MKFQKTVNQIFHSKTKLFLVLAISILIVIVILDIFDNDFSYHDILVESHGLVFDLLIFGILLTYFESKSSREESIKRYTEEINDYKFWKTEEAMYRTRGLVKRLVDLNAEKLNLSHCYLASDKSFSQYKNMKGWEFNGADLTDSFFMYSDMTDVKFYIATLNDSRFTNVNLTNAHFGSANLLNTEFLECNLTNTNFSNCFVSSPNWLSELVKQKNVGSESILKRYVLEKKVPDNGFQYFQVKEQTC